MKEDNAPLSVVIIGKLIIIAVLAGTVYLVRQGHHNLFIKIIIGMSLLIAPYLIFEWKHHPFELLRGLAGMVFFAGVRLLILSPFFIAIALSIWWFGKSESWVVLLVGWGLIILVGFAGLLVQLLWEKIRAK